MTEIFNFISDDDEDEDYQRQYKILVLGEAGVGKTSFIRALKEHIAFQRHSFLESEYHPTKSKFTEKIPETNTNSILCDSVLNHIENGRYNHEVARFIMKPHVYKEEEFFLIDRSDRIQTNIPASCNIGELEIVEMPSTTRSFPPNFEYQFDKIIIMCDYHDITTIRSIQYWVETIKTPASKLIVCVNMCDSPPISVANDFRSRKATILRHFFENCKLEFISVKTGANLAFLYKHL
jgi:GTPase SAR1 family protein